MQPTPTSDSNIENLTKQIIKYCMQNDADGLHELFTTHRITSDILNNLKHHPIHPLHVLAVGCKLEAIKILLKNGANVNATSFFGNTPLHLASSRGHTEVVKTLIEANVDVNATNCWSETPLYLASSRGHTEVVKTLIEANADINAADFYPETPLHIASSRGHTEVVKTLIEKGAIWDKNNVFFNQQENEATIILALISIASDEPSLIKKLQDDIQNPHKLQKIKENGVYFVTKILQQAQKEGVDIKKIKDQSQALINPHQHNLPLPQAEIELTKEQKELKDWALKTVFFKGKFSRDFMPERDIMYIRKSSVISSDTSTKLADSEKLEYQQKMQIIDLMLDEPKELKPLVLALNATKATPIVNNGGLEYKTFESKGISSETNSVIFFNLITQKVTLADAQKTELLSIFTHSKTQSSQTQAQTQTHIRPNKINNASMISQGVIDPRLIAKNIEKTIQEMQGGFYNDNRSLDKSISSSPSSNPLNPSIESSEGPAKEDRAK